jgi:hypothetical protein
MKELVAVLVLAVAACRPDAPVPPVAAPATPAPERVAAAPAAPAKELFAVTAGQKTFPAPFIGTWDARAERCGEKRSDARLKITATTMTFWESGADVTAITPVATNVIDVDGKFAGELEQWDRRLRMELAGEADTLIITSGDQSFTRVKCP